jgi:hypothetical protein
MTRLLTTIIVFSFLCSTPAKAETLILPVSDLLFEITNFNNAPEFYLNQAMAGQNFLGDLQKLPKEKRKKIEKQLIDIVWEYYPDATSIRLFRGNILVTLP